MTELTPHLQLLLKLEELLIFVASVVFFALLTDLSWWFFALLFFVPDISIAAYLINTRIGSVIYNLFHHKGLMIILSFLGYYLSEPILMATGLIFLGHSSFDRLFGYGLKFPDNFKHTHLGKLASN